MTKKSERQYRRIKRSHVWNSIVEFIIFAALSAVILAFATTVITEYLLETKLSAEYDRITYMAQLYENSQGEHDGQLYDMLTKEDRDYLVLDGKGKVIDSYGEDTRSDESDTVSLSIYNDNSQILVFRDDSNRNFIYPNNGKISFAFRPFFTWMSSDEDEMDKDTEYAMDSNEGIINLPLWMTVSLADGKQFVGKAVFSMIKRDLMTLFYIILSLAGLVVIILFTLLVAGIRNFIRQRHMIRLFFSDMVTDGYNRTWYMIKGERLLRKKAKKYKFAVISLSFINYNTFCICHSVKEGEKLLADMYKKACSLLKSREMCAHLGAAEFGLILRYENEYDLKARLEDMTDKLNAIDEDHAFYFHAGVVPIDRAVDEKGNPVSGKEIDIDTVYSNAVAAKMSAADTEDTVIVFFDDKLLEDQKWLDKVQEMQQAALEKEEFRVYYQPKYDPRTNELRGAEALIRWDSPELGFVSPGRFIPIFEKNGFITEIDHYMLEHVAADQKAWLDEGRKCVPVSVNVSRAHFIENDLAEQIRDIVDKAGTPHQYIEIELTESAFFDDKKAMLSTIAKLKGYGFAVSMDDFGSGYSSLNSLKDMPLDVLKLDAEFFRGDTGDKRGEIVVSEAIKLGKCLNMRIVAEGVEFKEQVDFLAQEGCDMIQGYYFAKPMPKDEYASRMTS